MEQQRRKTGARRWIWAGLALILLTELGLRVVFLPERPGDRYLVVSILAEWALALLLLWLWLPRVERMGWRSVGLTRFRLRHLWIGALLFLAQLVVTSLLGAGLDRLELKTFQDLVVTLGALGWTARIALFSAGAFPEELFYRGYLIERLALLTGSLPLAAAASWACFTLIHLPFMGLGPTLQTGVLSAALVTAYLWQRSLWPCVVIHAINNAFAYLVLPVFLAGAGG